MRPLLLLALVAAALPASARKPAPRQERESRFCGKPLYECLETLKRIGSPAGRKEAERLSALYASIPPEALGGSRWDDYRRVTEGTEHLALSVLQGKQQRGAAVPARNCGAVGHDAEASVGMCLDRAQRRVVDLELEDAHPVAAAFRAHARELQAGLTALKSLPEVQRQAALRSLVHKAEHLYLESDHYRERFQDALHGQPDPAAE